MTALRVEAGAPQRAGRLAAARQTLSKWVSAAGVPRSALAWAWWVLGLGVVGTAAWMGRYQVLHRHDATVIIWDRWRQRTCMLDPKVLVCYDLSNRPLTIERRAGQATR